MGKILIGLVFVMLDFDLTSKASGAVIGLLPDFVGYVLIWLGLRQMRAVSDSFDKGVRLCLYCTVPATSLYAMNVVGGDVSFLALFLQLLEMVLRTIVLFRIACGVMDLEKEYGLMLRGRLLKTIWIVLTVFSVISLAGILIPIVGGIASMASSIVALVFLVIFYLAKQTYEDALSDSEDEE